MCRDAGDGLSRLWCARMSLLGGFRADQLVNQLVAEPKPDSPSARKLVDRIKKVGGKVIPKAIDALALSDKSHTMVFVDILSSLVSDKTLDLYKEGLADGNEREPAGLRLEAERLTAEAGVQMAKVATETKKAGLTGMEFGLAIPGSVGGALRMNAGAFGQEIAQTTIHVNGFRLDGTPFTAKGKEINFSYRQVPDLEQVVLTSAIFGFKQTDAAKLRQRMNDILVLRAKKQPLDYPSCGSVFKRPPGYYAGALIEEAGLKGERIGGAIISPKHAGFILNTDNASAADVLSLIRKIEDNVWQRFGVKLEREVKLIGEFDEEQ